MYLLYLQIINLIKLNNKFLDFSYQFAHMSLALYKSNLKLHFNLFTVHNLKYNNCTTYKLLTVYDRVKSFNLFYCSIKIIIENLSHDNV